MPLFQKQLGQLSSVTALSSTRLYPIATSCCFVSPRGCDSTPSRSALLRHSKKNAISSIGALLGHCRCLNTSASLRTPASSSLHPKVSRSSAATDGLLSRWSRRPPASPTASAPPAQVERASSTPKTTQGQKDKQTVDRLNVEELLLFEEDDEAKTKATFAQSDDQHSMIAQSSGCATQQAGAPATPADASAARGGLPERVAAATTPSLSVPRTDAMGEDDADVYGMASSAASHEGQLLDDLLQQAALDSAADSRLADDDDDDDDALMEDDDDADCSLTAETTQGSSTLTAEASQLSQAVAAEQTHLGAAQTAAAARDSANRQRDIAAAWAAHREAGRSPSNTPYPSPADTPEESHSRRVSRLDQDEDVKEEEAEEAEEESLDTVLEEETDRMLQAALDNMVKESAANAAARASGGGRPANMGTGSYVFFAKEAVMAAAESLAAAEQLSAGQNSAEELDAVAGRVAAAAAGEGDFNDDAVREAELESLGLNMDTSK